MAEFTTYISVFANKDPSKEPAILHLYDFSETEKQATQKRVLRENPGSLVIYSGHYRRGREESFALAHKINVFIRGCNENNKFDAEGLESILAAA